ncbi:MAG: acyl-ACP--UDP-N-acetylglucosamine O-acyltransferase [Phycisphaerales bacterium]|nr:MAG: acyl-ACP--UDP-N-acetylglucosamine O-acyltransferase [Phycisphaerales bacterium]
MTTASSTSPTSAPFIHPSAFVDREAILEEGVRVGPMCVIVGKVHLKKNVQLVNSCTFHGPLTIGENTIVYPYATLGLPPQDYKFKPGDATAGVSIGSDCIIREGVTVHSASKPERPTTIGNRVFMMANSHAGHDALVGDNCILVNGALLAGHTTLQNNVTMSGGTMLQQFCRIGRMAFLSGGVAMAVDLPPFCISGSRNTVSGLNVVGLRRAGIPRDDISALRAAFRDAFQVRLPKQEMIAILRDQAAGCSLVGELADFIETSKKPVAIYRDLGESVSELA